ncbi:MAG TPA: ABC transporter permease, partial [Rhizomicrobium sp.]
MQETEARRQAALAFGNQTAIRENCRELKLSAVVAGSLQDMRYAARGLLRNRIFAITTIASLGLAIGANTAIYSIVDAALLRPLPVPQADRLVTLETSGEGLEDTGNSADRELFSYSAFEQLGAAAGDSARLALFGSANRVEARDSTSDDSPYEEVMEQFISPNAFEVLAVVPALGRFFSPAEDHYPAPRAVAVLSYQYWQRRFGGDPAVLGRTLVIDSRPFSILGIAPKGFSGTEPGRLVDVWLPVTMFDPGIFTDDVRLFRLMGHLTPGVRRSQLAARLQPSFHRYQELSIRRSNAPADVQQSMRAAIIVVNAGANGAGGFRR